MYKLLLLAFVTGCIDDVEATSETSAELTGSGMWMEAEVGSISGALSVQTNVTSASGGRYVRVDGSGYARTFFNLNASEPELYVWIRAITPSTTANTIGIQLDNDNYTFEAPVSAAWEWIPVGAGGGGRYIWSLLDGNHTFRINGTEPGVMIDRVLITSSYWYVPVAETIEAEAGSVVAPMRFATQRLPYATYAYVPNGAGTGGRLDLDVGMSAGGSYHGWGRANAASTDDNRFTVYKQGGSMQSWSPPVTSLSGWTWSRLPAEITFGTYDILSFTSAEDGTKLDKIVITNDPGFSLVESSPPPVKTL